MKSSREKFEEWIYKNRMRGVPFDIEVFDVDGAIFYKSTETQGQWNAWQASRAAIEIVLPDCDDYQSTWQYRDAAELKIKGLGLSVK